MYVDAVCKFLVMAVTMSKFKCHFGPDAFLASLMMVLNGSAIGYGRQFFLRPTTRWQSLLVSPIVKRLVIPESRKRSNRGSWHR